jgi:hypothetical protein
MAIGNQPNVGGLNSQLGDVAIQLRNAAESAQQLWAYVNALGSGEAAQVAALVVLGFNSTDAQNFWTDSNYAFAVSELYYGQITQATAFNYDSALAMVRGGQ